ncbi:MAG: hydrogenase maturation protease [Anaerolineae bacterium]
MLVIGYGDVLRRDDGIGQRVATQLSERPTVEHVDIVLCHQLTPELAEPISRACHVLFIDAAIGGEPGNVTIASIDPMPATVALTHHVTPEALLALAHEWYCKAPNGTLITVCGETFGYGNDLSPTLEKRLPEIVDWIEQGLMLAKTV